MYNVFQINVIKLVFITDCNQSLTFYYTFKLNLN